MNRIDDGGGADLLRGAPGNDIAIGRSEADNLFGGFAGDRPIGVPGQDVLAGGFASDVMVGGEEVARVPFSMALGTDKPNLFQECEVGFGLIRLKKTAFVGPVAGRLVEDALAESSTGRARGASDRVITQAATGKPQSRQ